MKFRQYIPLFLAAALAAQAGAARADNGSPPVRGPHEQPVPEILNGVVRAARVMTLEPGKDYDVLALSFDAREGPSDAAAKKAVYMKEINQPQAPAAWH